MRYSFLFLGFGFRREGSWVVWKRKVLGLEEKPFAEQEKEGRGEKKIVLTPFVWGVKLDRCQNFKLET